MNYTLAKYVGYSPESHKFVFLTKSNKQILFNLNEISCILPEKDAILYMDKMVNKVFQIAFHYGNFGYYLKYQGSGMYLIYDAVTNDPVNNIGYLLNEAPAQLHNKPILRYPMKMLVKVLPNVQFS